MTQNPPSDAAQPDDDPGAGDPFDGPDWERPPRRRARTSPEQVRRRVHGRSRRKRRMVWGGLIFGVLVVAALGWLAYTALAARSELQTVRAEVSTMRTEIASGDFAAARATAKQMRGHAARAHDLTTGPIWASAAAIPYLGDPLDTARTVSADVDRISSDALPPLIEASSSLDPKTLRRSDGSFALEPIQRVVPLLGNAVRVLQDSVHDLSGSSGSTWLSPINSARSDLLNQLPPLVATLRNADIAARTVPAMLGADGPKRYFVSFESEAELRGLGGLPGAFAILQADQGKISFERFESDTALFGFKSGLSFGPDFAQLYSSTPDVTSNYADSDISPHFPYAARIWLAQWKAKTGEQLDGAMALDPTALSYLLRVTGPARLPDGSQISASNVVKVTQQTTYIRYGAIGPKGDLLRKKYLLEVARAASHQLVSNHGDPTALVRAAAKAASEHRLVVWSADAGVEQELAATPISGQVPVTSAPYVGLALNNGGATKLDYYLHAALDRTSTGCGHTRNVTVTIRLTNDAPTGLPSYVYGQTGRPGLPSTPGINRTLVTYFATTGAQFTRVTINGKPSGAGSGTERGHPAFGLTVDTPPGGTTTIVLTLTEPGAAAAPVTRIQPMVSPVAVSLRDGGCGS